MTPAERVRAWCDAWEDAGRGPHCYAGLGRTVDTEDPTERLTIADLRALTEEDQ